jgi:hypothetical protein
MYEYWVSVTADLVFNVLIEADAHESHKTSRAETTPKTHLLNVPLLFSFAIYIQTPLCYLPFADSVTRDPLSHRVLHHPKRCRLSYFFAFTGRCKTDFTSRSLK